MEPCTNFPFFPGQKGAKIPEREPEQRKLTLVPVKLGRFEELRPDLLDETLPFLTEVTGVVKKVGTGRKRDSFQWTLPSGTFDFEGEKNSQAEREAREETISAIVRKELDVPVVGKFDPHFLVGEAYVVHTPPFIPAHPFTVHQVETRRLTTDNLDSIFGNSPAVTESMREELTLKICENDLVVWQRVVDRLVEAIGDEDLDRIWQDRKKALNQRTETPSKVHRNTIRNFLTGEVMSRIGGEEFSLQLRRAHNEIYLEEGLRYLEKAGPQKPFLISQIVLGLGDEATTPSMIKKIRAVSPLMAIFYNTVLDFVDPDKGIDEYFSWKEVMDNFRARVKNGDNILVLRRDFSRRFSRAVQEGLKMEISDFDWNRADDFLRYLIEQAASGSTGVNNLMDAWDRVKQADDPLSLVELLSGEAEDVRWQAMRKLFFGILITQAEKITAEVHGATIGVIPAVFDEGVTEKSPRGGETREIGGRRVRVVTRDKSIFSILRKLLNRGKSFISNGEQEITSPEMVRKFFGQIKDFEGGAVILQGGDYDDCLAAARLIVARTTRQVEGGNINIGRVIVSNCRLNEGWKPEEVFSREGVFGDTGAVSRYEYVVEKEIKNPSVASYKKIPWSWVKFVVQVEDEIGNIVSSTEWQVFNSEAEYEKKERDDKFYALKRLVSSWPGKWSLGSLIWGPEEVYKEIMTLANKKLSTNH